MFRMKTPTQIRDAVLSLSRTQLLRLRRYAQWRINRPEHGADAHDYQDLLREALTATVAGDCPWVEGIDFFWHLVRATRTISSRWEEARAEWKESRQDQLFFVEGEKRSGAWTFFERSTWDVCWHPRIASPELIAKAEQISAEATRPVSALRSSHETSEIRECLGYILGCRFQPVAVL